MISYFIIAKKENIIVSDMPETKETISIQDWLILITGEYYKKIEQGGYSYIIIGDLINLKDVNPNFNIQRLKGNFYIIRYKQDLIEIYNNVFSTLPIYYSEDKKIFSNSLSLIKTKHQDIFKTDKQFILENILFNYSFSNRTIYTGIKLLPSNSYVKIKNDQIDFIKHTEITNYYSRDLKGVSKTRRTVADFYINTVKEYFPDEPFSITLTGGFDGRTIVSCARYYKKIFSTCSFGKKGNLDIEIPLANTKELDIPYNAYLLNDADYTEHSYNVHSKHLITICPGSNAYIYPHFSYLASKESEKANYLLTGYCGSELFRAIHLTGAVTSSELIKIFNIENDEELRLSILNSYRLKVLKFDLFKDEFENLILEILDYRKNLPKDFSQNQTFYIYVFEEIFRKVFGTLIYAQQHFINVRTPFLDFDLIVELLKTKFAGANNEYYTTNPVKRFKGQVVYAEIIKRTSLDFYKFKTGKGYRPSDIIEPFGLINILLPYFKKRLTSSYQPPILDNLGIISGFNNLKSSLNKISNLESSELFDLNYLNKFIDGSNIFPDEKQRDLILHAYSIINVFK